MSKDDKSPGASNVVCTCCMCGMVRKNDTWIEDDSAPNAPRTHTYCPTCLGQAVHDNFPGHTESILGKCVA